MQIFMKIAYVTTYDSSDIKNWSGSGFFIRSSLEQVGFEVHPIGSLSEPYKFQTKMKKGVYKYLLGKNYHREREPQVLMNYANQVTTALLNVDHDLIFCPGTTPITYLNTIKPIVVWLDSTFACGMDFYPYYTNLCKETIKKGNETTQIALSKCSLIILSSQWAANKTIEKYEINPDKVKVVPFGANIECARTTEDITRIVDGKDFNTCRLLFLGVDWYRKGGDLAVKVAERLNNRGLRTELHIVGCDPDEKTPDFAIRHGFVSKTTEAGKKLLDKLFTDAHFLILPSRAEYFGIVFSEASSYGVFSLATNVGGIPSAISDGKNGQTFPLAASPEAYCEIIEKYFSSKEEYRKLALSSFKEYETRLNWTVSGKKVRHLIESYCF